MWDNQLHENSYVWHERNIQNVLRAVTKRPSPDWSAREDLEEETEEWVRKRLGDYIDRIQIGVLRFLGGKNKENDGRAIFVEMKAGSFLGLKKNMSSKMNLTSEA